MNKIKANQICNVEDLVPATEVVMCRLMQSYEENKNKRIIK